MSDVTWCRKTQVSDCTSFTVIINQPYHLYFRLNVPQTFSLAIAEIDEAVIGRFSFRNRESLLNVSIFCKIWTSLFSNYQSASFIFSIDLYVGEFYSCPWQGVLDTILCDKISITDWSFVVSIDFSSFLHPQIWQPR